MDTKRGLDAKRVANEDIQLKSDADEEFSELTKKLKMTSNEFNFDWLWNCLSHVAISLTCVAIYHVCYVQPAHEQKLPVTVDYAALSNAKLAELAEQVRLSNGENSITAQDLEYFIAQAKSEIASQSQDSVVYVSGAIASEAHDITEFVAKALGVDLNKKIAMSLPHMADKLLGQQTAD